MDHASGVEAALRVSEGAVLYELKLPLAATSDHPVRRQLDRRQNDRDWIRDAQRSITRRPKLSMEAAVEVATGTAGGGMGGGRGGGMHGGGGGMHGGGSAKRRLSAAETAEGVGDRDA